MGLSAPSLQLTTSIYRMGLPRNNAYQRFCMNNYPEGSRVGQRQTQGQGARGKGQEVKGKRQVARGKFSFLPLFSCFLPLTPDSWPQISSLRRFLQLLNPHCI